MKQFIAVRHNDEHQTPITVKLEDIDYITVYDESLPSNVSTARISFKDGTEIETTETYDSLIARLDNAMLVV